LISCAARAPGGVHRLGQKEIPAVILEVEEEDCFVMSLVENLARRQHSPLELVEEIGALKKRDTRSMRSQERRFQHGIYLRPLLPAGDWRGAPDQWCRTRHHSGHVAMEIAKAKDSDVQVALADAYENKALPGNQCWRYAGSSKFGIRAAKGCAGAGPARAATERRRPRTCWCVPIVRRLIARRL